MNGMTSRERVLKTMEHKEPDRIPIDLGGYLTGITVNAYNKVKKLLGFTEKTKILELKQGFAVPDEGFLKHFNIDTRYIFPRSSLPCNPKKLPDGSSTFVVEWCHQTMIKKPNSPYYEFYDYPLAQASIENIDQFSWPDPDAPQRVKGLKEEIENLCKNTECAITTSLGAGVFERAWYLRGMERFFIDTIENLKFVERLLDKVLEIEKKLYGNFLSITGKYLDVVQIWDDLGAQDGPLISPNFFREIIKPRDRELIQLIKSKTKAKIMFHSCGSVYRFIPDLIEIGVDALNPIQVSAKDMDTAKLKKEFGNDISFWGAIDTQKVLPFGTSQEVKEEVKQRIDDLASGGGYILASVHNIQDGIPPENIVAMYETAKKCGVYNK